MREKTTPVDIESRARNQDVETRNSVRAASAKKIASREDALASGLKDHRAMQQLAARLRQRVIDDLPRFLEMAEEWLKSRGMTVHYADTAEEAREIIGGICKASGSSLIVKSKSMATEEINLNEYLEQQEFNPIETDLGEFVVQIAGDRPSHIVTPIIHVNGRRVARLFADKGLGEYTEDPEKLTKMARRHMRELFRDAGVGITGANFVAADTGRIVTVSNEGNLRFSANGPRVHIALAGIDKLIARELDLTVLLKLLARFSTGQAMTVYTQFWGGPRSEGELDGPEESHVIFLNNGRTNLLGGKYREMLRCIRCGACLNVCPVYRAVTGHSYNSVYPGPMGAILSPLLGGEDSMEHYAWLPKASSLCGACEEVCPVSIPIPKMLVGLRNDLRDKAPSPKGTPKFGPWTYMATRPRIWRATLAGGRTFGWGPTKLAPMPAFTNWLQERELPTWPKNSFRQYWKSREGTK